MLGLQSLEADLVFWAFGEQLRVINTKIIEALQAVRRTGSTREAWAGRLAGLRAAKALAANQLVTGDVGARIYPCPHHRLDGMIANAESQLRELDAQREQDLIALNHWLNRKDNAIEQLSRPNEALRQMMAEFGVS